MTEFGKHLCRLCLSVVNNNFTIIEDCTRDMFNVVLLKHDFDNGTGVTCSGCSEKLFAAFEFKSASLHTENTIKTHVYCDEGFPLDMGDIYMKEIENKQLVSVLDGQKVCRLCMELVEGEFMSVHEIDSVVIQSYVPEINFDFTKDPVVCKACFDSLHTHVNFLEKCVNAQREIIENSVNEIAVCVKNEDVKIEKSEKDAKLEILIETEEVLIKSEEYDDDRIQKNSETQHIDNQNSTGDNLYKCNECDFQSKHRRGLSSHQVKHLDVSEVQIYKCDKCNYWTKFMGTLAFHQMKHKDNSEGQLHKCNECDFQAKRKDNLTRHQLRHKSMSEVETYKCTECDFQTKYKKSLFSHQLRHRDVHEVELYKCDKCEYKSKFKGNVALHQLKHKDISETQVFKCEECDFQTKHKQSLSCHKLRHRDTSEVEIYKCDECDYHSRFKTNLALHRLKHRNLSDVQMYKCIHCDFQTKRKKSLAGHQLRHKDTSEVPVYKCDKCDYETKFKRILVTHQLRHKDASEMQTYRCNVCDFQTKYRRSLQRHYQLKHGGGVVCEQS